MYLSTFYPAITRSMYAYKLRIAEKIHSPSMRKEKGILHHSKPTHTAFWAG